MRVPEETGGSQVNKRATDPLPNFLVSQPASPAGQDSLDGPPLFVWDADPYRALLVQAKLDGQNSEQRPGRVSRKLQDRKGAPGVASRPTGKRSPSPSARESDEHHPVVKRQKTLLGLRPWCDDDFQRSAGKRRRNVSGLDQKKATLRCLACQQNIGGTYGFGDYVQCPRCAGCEFLVLSSAARAPET
eukprot:Polyplicarium_translucidae@DN4494_c0_g1_i1.p1